MSHDAKVDKEVTLELTVIRADGTRDELGVVASSRKRWQYSPAALLSRLRIAKANRRLADAQQSAGEETD